MDTATILHSSASYQSVSPSNRLRNPKRSTQTRPLRCSSTTFPPKSELMMGINNEGVFLNLLPLPLPNSSSNIPLHPRQQPPLLPSPLVGFSTRPFQSLKPTPAVNNSTTFSSPAHKKRNNGTRYNKEQARISQQSPISPLKTTNPRAKKSMIKQVPDSKLGTLPADSGRLGPDPGNLPITTIFTTKILFEDVHSKITASKLENFSGSVLAVSPPPSSLPFPNFSLRSKQLSSCKVEAAVSTAVGPPCGFDAGATDNLCRLLKLR